MKNLKDFKRGDHAYFYHKLSGSISIGIVVSVRADAPVFLVSYGGGCCLTLQPSDYIGKDADYKCYGSVRAILMLEIVDDLEDQAMEGAINLGLPKSHPIKKGGMGFVRESLLKELRGL